MFQNQYNEKGVILGPISDELLGDENLEPQMVRIRSQNSGFVYIDSKDNTSPRFNDELISSSGTIFPRKIRRFAVTEFFGYINIPTINSRNNTICFLSGLTNPVIHTVQIGEGYYATPELLMDAVVTALNSVSGASLITFSHAVTPLAPNFSVLSSAPAGYIILDSPECTAVTRGRYLLNLPTGGAFAPSKVVGSIQMYSTRFIDLTSFSLNQYTKNPSATSSALYGSNLLLRLYVLKVGEPYREFFAIKEPGWINMNKTQSLSAIDFGVYDEFGERLTFPDFVIPSASDNSMFILTIKTEV